MANLETIKLGGFVDEEVKKINDNFSTLNTAIPTVPTNVSSFENDKNYQTETQVTQAINSAVAGVTVPTKTSQLTNDSNFVTDTQVNNAVNSAVDGINVPTKLSELTNDANYVKTTDTAFRNKVDAEAGKGLSTNDYTTADKNKVDKLGKVDFTSSQFAAGAEGYQQATIAAAGKYPVKVMRQSGTEYEEVLVHTKVSGDNIVIVTSEAFNGYVVTI